MTQPTPADTLRAAAEKLRHPRTGERVGPGLSITLAQWLDSVAFRTRHNGSEWIGADLHHSLAVARAILGEDQP